MTTLDNHGNVTSGLTLHDVFRWLVRGGFPNTELNQQEALHAIDADENGFSNSADWKEELARRSTVAAELAASLGTADPAAQAEVQAEARRAALEAKVAQLEALIRAQSAPAAERPATPAAPGA